MTPAEQLIWAAGLFEGEGSVYLHHRPSMQIRMTDEDVLHRFARIVGVGKVYGPYVTRQSGPNGPVVNPKWKPNWLWSVRGADAIVLMALFFPLMCRRRAAKIAEVFNAYF